MKKHARRYWMVYLSCLLLLPATLQGQDPPCYSTFAVDRIDGCAPLTVNVTSHVSNESPIYTYEDGVTNSNISHTYQNAGQYDLVRIISPSCSGTIIDTIRITVYDNSPPTFEVDSCLNNIRVRITDNTYSWYQVWFQTPSATRQVATIASGESTIIDDPLLAGVSSYEVIVKGALADQVTTCGENSRTVSPLGVIPAAQARMLQWVGTDSLYLLFEKDPSFRHLLFEQVNGGDWQVNSSFDNSTDTFKIGGLNSESTYCYQLATLSDCENIDEITSPDQLNGGLSNLICSWPFEVSASEGFNTIRWNKSHPLFDQLASWNIQKDGSSIATLSANDSSYTDDDISCNTTYCYGIELSLSDNRTISMHSQCIKSLNAGKAIEARQLYASVEGDSLYIRWEVDTANISSFILHQVASGINTPIELPLGESYATKDFDLESMPCYYLDITDSCGNNSISDTTCVVYLRGEKEGEETVLYWSEFKGLNGNFFYMIERKDTEEENWTAVSSIGSGNEEYTYREGFGDFTARLNTYRIRAVSVTGSGLNALSNTVQLEERVDLLVPDAFTPNQDGLNDRLETTGIFLETATIKVFNRLGLLMFEWSLDEDGWDGYYEGELMPMGAYVYIATGTDVFGGTFQQKGTFLLLRK